MVVIRRRLTVTRRRRGLAVARRRRLSITRRWRRLWIAPPRRLRGTRWWRITRRRPLLVAGWRWRLWIARLWWRRVIGLRVGRAHGIAAGGAELRIRRNLCATSLTVHDFELLILKFCDDEHLIIMPTEI